MSLIVFNVRLLIYFVKITESKEKFTVFFGCFLVTKKIYNTFSK